MADTTTRLLPLSRKPWILKVIGRMGQAVNGFFRSRLVIATVTDILFVVG